MPNLKLGVFWDYENIRVPSGLGADVASNSIRKALTGLAIDNVGQIVIVERRLYFDSRAMQETSTNRTVLDLSGFTLVDCPSRGKKETLDKKIIVDIMFSATTFESQSGDRYGVALLSSDGDYAYMLNRVRDLGVFVVLIHAGLAGQPPITPSFLLNSADVVLHWKMDVLAESLTPAMPENWRPPGLPPPDSAGTVGGVTLGSHADAGKDNGFACPAAPDAGGDDQVDASASDSLPSERLLSEPLPSERLLSEPLADFDPADGVFDLLLTIIRNLSDCSPSGWAAHALVSHHFYKARGTRQSEQVRVLAAACHDHGLIRWGRRQLSNGVIVHVAKQGFKDKLLSTEVYVQTTSQGNEILGRESRLTADAGEAHALARPADSDATGRDRVDGSASESLPSERLLSEPLADSDPADGFFDLLLTIISELAGRSPSGWAAHALVSSRFYQARGTRDSELVRVLAAACHDQGLIRWGRRRHTDGVIVHVAEQGCKNQLLSAEVYVQTTSQGNEILRRENCRGFQ